MLVGLYLPRGVASVVGMLGILKAGGGYVPLDPGYPAARVAFMLADTAAPVVLTASGLSARLLGYAGRTVCLDSAWAGELAGQPATIRRSATWRSCRGDSAGGRHGRC